MIDNDNDYDDYYYSSIIVVVVVVSYDQQMILAKVLKICQMGPIILAWKAQTSKKLL